MEVRLGEHFARPNAPRPIQEIPLDPHGRAFAFAIGKKHNFLDHDYQKKHYYASEDRTTVEERYSRRIKHVQDTVDGMSWPKEARGNVTVYLAGTCAKMGDYFSKNYFEGELVAFLANAAMAMGQQPDADFVAVDGISSGNHDHSTRLSEPHPDESELSNSAMFPNAHHALQVLRQINSNKGINQINIMGWSRGGTTGIILANYLHSDDKLQHVPVNLFLIDPVPGWNSLSGIYAARHTVTTLLEVTAANGFNGAAGVNAAGAVMQGVQLESQLFETSAWGVLQKNVKHATIIYAGDERTKFFSPVKPRLCNQGEHSSQINTLRFYCFPPSQKHTSRRFGCPETTQTWLVLVRNENYNLLQRLFASLLSGSGQNSMASDKQTQQTLCIRLPT
jgi:hypothetical protein